jgi:hypothetical protein
MLDDLGIAHRILTGCGYCREFHSENVSHYVAADGAWGRIDILHAFRGPSLGMLRRAERLPAGGELTLPVVGIEDIIGLKVQALVNDPTRALSDWSDIQLLLDAAREQGRSLDWALVEDYLRLFDLEGRLAELKSTYGATDWTRKKAIAVRRAAEKCSCAEASSAVATRLSGICNLRERVQPGPQTRALRREALEIVSVGAKWLPCLRVRRNDRHEERAFLNLPAFLLILPRLSRRSSAKADSSLWSNHTSTPATRNASQMRRAASASCEA